MINFKIKTFSRKVEKKNILNEYIMIWNSITIGLYVLILILNGFSWYKYSNNTSAENRKKEGWSNYYTISTIFILILLIQKLNF